MIRSVISKTQYYQLIGLLVLSHQADRQISEIVAAMREITGEVAKYGHCADTAISQGETIDDLLKKLDITVAD